MARYRKKPIEVEAYKTDKEMIIHTLEGDMKANVGDYIITGVKGEQYPCKPEIFEATYEIPTADVLNKLENAQAEVSMQVIDEFLNAMRDTHEKNRLKYGGALALLLPDIEQIAKELKKKYTEGKNEGK